LRDITEVGEMPHFLRQHICLVRYWDGETKTSIDATPETVDLVKVRIEHLSGADAIGQSQCDEAWTALRRPARDRDKGDIGKRDFDCVLVDLCQHVWMLT